VRGLVVERRSSNYFRRQSLSIQIAAQIEVPEEKDRSLHFSRGRARVQDKNA
jgi:hypothetical protein